MVRSLPSRARATATLLAAVAVALLLAGLLGLVRPPAAAAAACPTPDFAVSPTTAAPGAGVQISGNNWWSVCPDDPSQPRQRDTGIRIMFIQGSRSTLIGTASAGSEGQIAGQVFIPNSATSGSATIRAEGTNGQPSVPFTVSGAPASTTSTTVRSSTTTSTTVRSSTSTTSTTVRSSTTTTTTRATSSTTSTTAAGVTTSTGAGPTTTLGSGEREFGAGGLVSDGDDDNSAQTPLQLVAAGLLVLALALHLKYLSARVEAADAAAAAEAGGGFVADPVVVPPGPDHGLVVGGLVGGAAAASAASLWQREDEEEDEEPAPPGTEALGEIEDLGDLSDLGDSERYAPAFEEDDEGDDEPDPADLDNLAFAPPSAPTTLEFEAFDRDEEAEPGDSRATLAYGDDGDETDGDEEGYDELVTSEFPGVSDPSRTTALYDTEDDFDDEVDLGPAAIAEEEEYLDDEDDGTDGDQLEEEDEPGEGSLRPTERAPGGWLDDED